MLYKLNDFVGYYIEIKWGGLDDNCLWGGCDFL